MPNKQPKVSIICALKDEIFTLDECLTSLVEQTYPNKEIIIIDHESVDGSTEVAKRYAKQYPWIKYYFLKHDPTYILEARVKGIEKSNGEILFVVDADAKYEPKYLETCVKHLKKKGVGGVFGKIRVWKKKNTFISKYRDAHYRIRWDDLDNLNKEAQQGKIAPWVFTRKLYDHIGGYSRKAGWSADVDYGKKMLVKGYKLYYEHNVQWWHRWREGLFETIGYALFWSRLDYGKKKPFREIRKMLYFAALPPLVVVSIFFPLLWWIVVAHTLPLFYNGFKLYKKAAKLHIPKRTYLFLTPFVSYAMNIPYAYGYFSNYIWPPKKQQ